MVLVATIIVNRSDDADEGGDSGGDGGSYSNCGGVVAALMVKTVFSEYSGDDGD